jgi:transposase
LPDVSSCAPVDVRLWVALDVHKRSIVAATLPPSGGRPEVIRIEHTAKAVRGLVEKLGGREGLAVAYEAGPTGWALKRLLDDLGVACDVIAPSLVPVRAGDRVKTDRRDAKKLVRLFRAGELTFVAAPTPEQEGLRDLVRCREDLRDALTRARQRVIKALLRHGRVFSDGKHWTIRHRTWVAQQQLADPAAQLALETMRAHTEMIETQLRQLDVQLDRIAQEDRWKPGVRVLTSFRGIATLTALSLLAEIGDFRRFGTARELMSYLGLCPAEYSSGQSVHRGHITKAGPVHARRLLIEAAWHYRHPPRLTERQRENANAARRDGAPELPPLIAARAWQAQVRLNHRHRVLTEHRNKRATVTNVAVARELVGFLWAAMTEQPLRQERAAA